MQIQPELKVILMKTSWKETTASAFLMCASTESHLTKLLLQCIFQEEQESEVQQRDWRLKSAGKTDNHRQQRAREANCSTLLKAGFKLKGIWRLLNLKNGFTSDGSVMKRYLFPIAANTSALSATWECWAVSQSGTNQTLKDESKNVERRGRRVILQRPNYTRTPGGGCRGGEWGAHSPQTAESPAQRQSRKAGADTSINCCLLSEINAPGVTKSHLPCRWSNSHMNHKVNPGPHREQIPLAA